MHKILYNLALIDTTNFCKDNNIDCSGSHLIKLPGKNKYWYQLVKTDTEKPLVTVIFYPSSVPSHIIY